MVHKVLRRSGQAMGRVGAGAGLLAVSLLATASAARADLCTTQARMSEAMRSGIAAAATGMARAIEAGDAAQLKSQTVAEYAANFDATAYLVRSTAPKLSGTTPQVTEMFALDGTTRKANDAGAADFSCALVGSSSEVDFSIAALPPGTYAFVLVEAKGANPWLLSFLLRQEGTAWKMAGFYPHPRSADGHDGLWYWSSARDRAKAGNKWLAWTLYGQADELLRPANFVTTTHLDALRTEQRSAAPGELSDGISAGTPLVVKGAGGREFHFTDLQAQGSDDGKRLNLMLHVAADTPEPADSGSAATKSGAKGQAAASGQDAAGQDPVKRRANNVAAAKALLDAHRELREGFASVWVFSETPGQNPFVTQHPMAEIP